MPKYIGMAIWCTRDERRVLVAGGSFLASTEILDLEAMASIAGPAMRVARFGCAAVALDADRVLVLSGANETHKQSEVLDVRAPATASSSSIAGPPMCDPHKGDDELAYPRHRAIS